MAYHKYFPHTSLKLQLVFKKKHLSNLEWPEGKINGRYSQRSPTSLTNGLAKSKLHNEDTIAYKILRATTTQDYITREIQEEAMTIIKDSIESPTKILHLPKELHFPPPPHTLS